jgi:hypothetical protein
MNAIDIDIDIHTHAGTLTFTPASLWDANECEDADERATRHPAT